MMTKLWLYAYSVGATSSRKLERLVQRDVGFMMLAAGNQPDFRTLNRFRLRHLKTLDCSSRCSGCVDVRAWWACVTWPSTAPR
jgi:transposase